jgi:hypothetical protein
MLVICGLLSLLSCAKFEADEMFALQVTAAATGEVRNLRGGKVSCMHCPMYFAFDASPAIVSAVISEHRLKRVVVLPAQAKEVEALVRGEASWWQPANPKGQDRLYWVSFSPRRPELERAFRLLVIKEDQAFFITSGHFSDAYYTQDET